MSFNSGFSAASTIGLATTALALSEADRQRRRYENAIETEYQSVARSISKEQAFREAATEMLGEIKAIANLKELDDAKDLKVRPHKFSLFEKDVSDELEEVAASTARKFLGQHLDRKIKNLAGQFYNIATYGLWEDPQYSGKVYHDTQGIALLDALDDKGLRAIARNGVSLSLQQYMEKNAKIGFFSGTSAFSATKSEITVEEQRALSKAIKHLADGVRENLETARRPDYAAITHQSPAYVHN